MWVIFREVYRWRPQGVNHSKTFQPGVPINVTHDCAEAAIAEGKADPSERGEPAPLVKGRKRGRKG